jgi:hypothetical protein
MIEIEVAMKTLAAAVSVFKLAGDVYTWLKGKQQSGVDPNLAAVLAKLPPHASAVEIVRAVSPLMTGVGGSVRVSAGHGAGGAGGDVNLVDRDIEAGHGTHRGGDIHITAGNGGPHGKGGDITITGGKFKAGDATGA